MDQFALLGSIAQQLHQDFIHLYYVFLPVFFALAIALDWLSEPSGSPAFIETLKRAFIATLMVASFQEVSDTILMISTAVADHISDMSGFDAVFRMASEKCHSYSLSPTSFVLGFNDMLIAILSFCSYLVLYIARYVTVALYHFMWLLLSILSPLLMLFHLFRGTESIPRNLYKTLIEVASWKILWAVMSAMITSLSFGNAYMADGNYLTVILLNFIIALGMLATPMMVKALIGGGLSTMAETIGMASAYAMVSAPGRAKLALQAGGGVVGDTAGFARGLPGSFTGRTALPTISPSDIPPPPESRDRRASAPRNPATTPPPAPPQAAPQAATGPSSPEITPAPPRKPTSRTSTQKT